MCRVHGADSTNDSDCADSGRMSPQWRWGQFAASPRGHVWRRSFGGAGAVMRPDFSWVLLGVLLALIGSPVWSAEPYDPPVATNLPIVTTTPPRPPVQPQPLPVTTAMPQPRVYVNPAARPARPAPAPAPSTPLASAGTTMLPTASHAVRWGRESCPRSGYGRHDRRGTGSSSERSSQCRRGCPSRGPQRHPRLSSLPSRRHLHPQSPRCPRRRRRLRHPLPNPLRP